MLLGDKYGTPRLPPKLSEEEFTTLKQLASENRMGELGFFDEYYKYNKNCVPPQYILDVCEIIASVRNT